MGCLMTTLRVLGIGEGICSRGHQVRQSMANMRKEKSTSVGSDSLLR